jgi:hypothetical protein
MNLGATNYVKEMVLISKRYPTTAEIAENLR